MTGQQLRDSPSSAAQPVTPYMGLAEEGRQFPTDVANNDEFPRLSGSYPKDWGDVFQFQAVICQGDPTRLGRRRFGSNESQKMYVTYYENNTYSTRQASELPRDAGAAKRFPQIQVGGLPTVGNTVSDCLTTGNSNSRRAC